MQNNAQLFRYETGIRSSVIFKQCFDALFAISIFVIFCNVGLREVSNTVQCTVHCIDEASTEALITVGEVNTDVLSTVRNSVRDVSTEALCTLCNTVFKVSTEALCTACKISFLPIKLLS